MTENDCKFKDCHWFTKEKHRAKHIRASNCALNQNNSEDNIFKNCSSIAFPFCNIK